MKKILTILLTMLLVFSLTLTSFAATIGDLLAGGIYADPAYIRPDITAQVKEVGGVYGASATVKASGVSALNPVVFDFNSTLGMYDVLGVKIENASGSMLSAIDRDDVHVKGQFKITIKYPNTIVVDAAELVTGSLIGFVKDASNGNMAIYNDTARTIVDNGNGTSTLTVDVVVKNPVDPALDYVTGAQLVANPEYLGDISYEFAANVGAYGTHPVTVTMRGSTEVIDAANGNARLMTVNYIPADPKSATATAIVTQPNPSRPSSPTGGTVVEKPVLNVFVKDGETFEVVAAANGKVDLSKVEIPEKPGYAISGFYSDESYQNEVTGVIDVNVIKAVYVRYINISSPDVLNNEEHFAYIIGYPDGTVKPNANITRDEVSTIIYRLMDAEERAKIESEENEFSDVDATVWSNKYVSTMANAGYVVGYEDGSFKPEASITRAEFATIVARLYANKLPDAADSKCNYTDIAGHWAEQYIKGIYALEIVNGYEDGTFRPDQYITRAEVMAIVNRVLVRYSDAEGVIEGVRVWSDVNELDWYYYDVVEATNTHTFERRANGYNEDHTSYGENEWVSTGIYTK